MWNMDTGYTDGRLQLTSRLMKVNTMQQQRTYLGSYSKQQFWGVDCWNLQQKDHAQHLSNNGYLTKTMVSCRKQATKKENALPDYQHTYVCLKLLVHSHKDIQDGCHIICLVLYIALLHQLSARTTPSFGLFSNFWPCCPTLIDV